MQKVTAIEFVTGHQDISVHFGLVNLSGFHIYTWTSKHSSGDSTKPTVL